MRQLNRATHAWMLACAVVALALNLRPAIASIGPLLDMIERATGLTHTTASLLTTLPVLVMGIVALTGRRLRSALGERRGIGLGAGLIGLASLSRWLTHSAASLVISAIVAGVGIALVQTLLPAYIKRSFGSAAGRVMGLFTTGIMGGAAIAAVLAAPLAARYGWPLTLAAWSIPAFVCLPLWLTVTRSDAQATDTPLPSTELPPTFARNWRAWELLLFFGIGTGAYTLVLAWLPPFYVGLGWSRAEAGMLLGGLTLTEVGAGLLISACIDRFPDRRKPLLVILTILLSGIACLIFAPTTLALPACGLLGLGIGALFPLSLILTLDHLADASQSGELAAFVQGGGYLIASMAPLVAGILSDRFANLSQAWISMAIGVVLLAAMSLRFSPASYGRLRSAAHTRT